MYPGGTSGKESACQGRRCKGYGLDPWVGKITWRRKWQPTPVFFPGQSHGQRSLVGYGSWGHKESDTTEHMCTHTHTHTHTCAHTHTHVCTQRHMCAHMHTHTCVHTCVCVHIHTRVHAHRDTRTRVCVHTCACTRIHTCAHTHTMFPVCNYLIQISYPPKDMRSILPFPDEDTEAQRPHMDLQGQG